MVSNYVTFWMRVHVTLCTIHYSCTGHFGKTHISNIIRCLIRIDRFRMSISISGEMRSDTHSIILMSFSTNVRQTLDAIKQRHINVDKFVFQRHHRPCVKLNIHARLSEHWPLAIRIYHECEGRIENPSRRSPFGITRLAGDPVGQIFLSYHHTNNGLFFLLITFLFIYLFIYLSFYSIIYLFIYLFI